MAEPDEKPRPLELETRGETTRRDVMRDFTSSRESPALILERWAIVARRIRAGYAGYEATEEYQRVRSFVERRTPPTPRRPWSALMDRLRPRRGKPDEPIRERR